jgi:hypothetical protein
MFKDYVHVRDSGMVKVSNLSISPSGAQVVDYRIWEETEPTIIEYKGWVKCLMRERGKIVPGSFREGHNIWTNAGREYDALKKTISVAPSTPYRTDLIGYIGVGTGTQTEDVNVLSLVTPVVVTAGIYLAALDPADFPLGSVKTVVRYKRTFAINEITITGGSTANLSEIGLFTNGSPLSSYAVNTRNTAIGTDVPVAYKTFEPIQKRDTLEFEVQWEIHH